MNLKNFNLNDLEVVSFVHFLSTEYLKNNKKRLNERVDSTKYILATPHYVNKKGLIRVRPFK